MAQGDAIPKPFVVSLSNHDQDGTAVKTRPHRRQNPRTDHGMLSLSKHPPARPLVPQRDRLLRNELVRLCRGRDSSPSDRVRLALA